ncbi:MAG TPA: hypothetical protein PLY62_06985, partial [Bacteroidales bacterium]|nr:hypothetical protein [Bacteroidales bacterium]
MNATILSAKRTIAVIVSDNQLRCFTWNRKRAITAKSIEIHIGVRFALLTRLGLSETNEKSGKPSIP